MDDVFKVGDLARRTGLSVRTLRFYDEIGLLQPSDRNDAGHRLYTADDVARLQRIVSLRSLGLTLEEIGDLLDGREGAPAAVIRRHVEHLRGQIAAAQALATRLGRLADRLDAGARADVPELLRAIEETVVYEKYYTPEQLADLEKRRQDLGPEGMQRAQQEWADVIAEAKAAYAAGKPVDDPEVEALARRWNVLIDQFTGRDPGILQGLAKLWRENTEALSKQSGMDPEVAAYMGRARDRLK